MAILLIVAVSGFIGFYSNFYFVGQDLSAQLAEPMPPLIKVEPMKAVYITANVALGARVNKIIGLIKETELNAIVIDIKDDRSTFLDDDMKQVIRRLRFAEIFPIARLPVFQHGGLALEHPEWALQTANGSLWRDSGGRYWVDPASRDIWQIILEETRQAAKMGFGEINLDYIRFPSDGKLEGVIYPVWDKQASRAEIINNFSRFIADNLKKEFPEVQLTADLFGYLLLRDDDQGIGQSITELAGIFDYIYPMVYPSHYDSGNFNLANPASHPYEVVYQSLESGKKIFAKHQTPFTNIRPWIQDFNLGAIYTPEMVRLQMRATTDAGLIKGWLIWNPNNRYRKEIFEN